MFQNSFAGHEENTENNRNKKIVVSRQRCPQNHPCPSVRVCPVSALSQKGFAAPEADHEKCIRCGKCVQFCPKRAISFE